MSLLGQHYLYNMKTLLFVLILVLEAGLPGYTQSIPEGANGIDLQTSMADSTLYTAVQDFLETQDYVIEEADEARYTLTTEHRKGPNKVQMRVLVTVENGTARFTAEGSILPGNAARNELLVYEDEGKAGFMILNQLVDQLAKSFDLATIEYVVP